MSDSTPAALDQALLPGVALGQTAADAPVDHAELLGALAAVWPGGGELLNPQGEALLTALISQPPAQPTPQTR